MMQCVVRAGVALALAAGQIAMAQEEDADIRSAIEAERQLLSEQTRRLEEQLAEYEAQQKRLDELESRLSDDRIPEVEKTRDEADSGVAPERLETGDNETRDSHEVMTAGDLAADDFVGSWPMFGSNYRMKIGGYVKLDALYDFDGTGDKTQFLIAQIPVDGSPAAQKDGYFNMFARETRFNFDVRQSSDGGPEKQLFLEMDFFDESSFSPRLRHAYVVYGNLLFGQTWTTIADLSSLPFTIDFGAGDALFGTRTAQVRWQEDWNETWSWTVGLENLQFVGIYNPNNLPGEATTKLPVFAGRITKQTSNGRASLAALVQELRWDGQGLGPDASATGWALIYAGRRNLKSGDFWTWNIAYGDGTPETIMALTGSNANAVLEADGSLTTRKGYSVALGYGHRWTERLMSNFAYAFTDLENLGLDQRAPDAIESGGVGHANLIWQQGQFSTGVELILGRRDNADGRSGDATRVQAMLKYGF
jgi:hypothetical protein